MRRTTAVMGIGALGAAIWGVARALRCRQNVTLSLEQPTRLDADVVIGRVADISSEPAMIPFVKSVEILDQSPSAVEYIVRGCAFRIPWWMHYRKLWNYRANMVNWSSVDGSFSVENTGRLTVERRPSGNVIRLTTGYSVGMPVGSRFIERMLRPLLAYAFGVWLKRLSR